MKEKKADDRPLRFRNATLDALLGMVKDEWQEGLPPSEQTVHFYDLVDRYNRARSWHKLYGGPVPYDGGIDKK